MLRLVESGVKAEDRASVASILKESGAIDAALGEANKLVDEALDVVAGLREKATKEGRESALAPFDSLERLARFVVKREN